MTQKGERGRHSRRANRLRKAQVHSVPELRKKIKKMLDNQKKKYYNNNVR